MLSPKPWKVEAIIRLLLSIFICVCAGSLLVSVVEHLNRSNHSGARYFLVTAVAFLCLGITLLQLRRTWALEILSRRLAIVAVFFYAGVLLTAWAETMAGPIKTTITVLELFIGMLSFQGAALFLVWLFLQEQQMSWADAFGLLNNPGKALLWGIILASIFLPLGVLLQTLSVEIIKLVPHFPAKPEEQQAVQTLRLATTWLERTLLGFVTIALAPAAEETLFRGIIYPALKQAGYPRLALGLTSFLFAAIHMNAAVFLPLFVLAVLLTAVYEKTGNLLAPIVAHALFNGIEFTWLYMKDYYQI